MKYMKPTDEILSQVFTERRSSESTQKSYTRAVRFFEEYTRTKLGDLLIIADDEETRNIHWKNSSLKPILINYRAWLYDKYKEKTANLYFTAITTIFRHYEIIIGPLPYFSRKNIKKSSPIKPGELPDRELLSEIIGVSTPLLKAVILLASSSGLSRIDLLNLKVKDYLKATEEYHHSNDIFTAISKMNDSEVDIIPTFILKRQKTAQEYYTFCSHEAVNAVNNYLMSRTDDFNKNSPLFKVAERYLNNLFTDMNKELNLGSAGTYGRFTPHMLRRYHATQLTEAGMSSDKINILEGRKVHGVIHESYIRMKPEVLKKEYIKALPFIVVEDINKVRTELDVTLEKNNKLVNENSELKKQNAKTNKRLDNLEKIVLGNVDEDDLEKLHKLL